MPNLTAPVAILTYHRIVPDGRLKRFHNLPASIFERQVAELASRTVGVTDGLLQLESGRGVCLTFDDGTADHGRVANVLAAYRLPGTFFMVAGRLSGPDACCARPISDHFLEQVLRTADR